MSKAIKQKLKERRQQCALSVESVTGFSAEQSSCFEDVPNSETLCEVSAWDMDFKSFDEQSEFDQYDERDSTISCESVSAEKVRENLKSKLVAMRHKPNISVPTEQLSDYLGSLNARDAVPPPILMRGDVPDTVQESTLSEPGNPPPPAPILKKAPKTQYIVGMTGELKKRVSIISYGNALYYHNGYYYAYLDLMALAKEQIKLAFEQSEREVVDLHQRTREGLLTARLNGKQVGRKKGVSFETKKAREAKKIIRTHCKTFGGTLDDAECMKLTGLARNTCYKYKRQIREDAEMKD